MRGLVGLALALLLAIPGCEQDTAAPMERETFISVMVELRRAGQAASSQAEFDAQKAGILERAGVTEADLRLYARQAPANARELAEAYDSIAARLLRYHEPE